MSVVGDCGSATIISLGNPLGGPSELDILGNDQCAEVKTIESMASSLVAENCAEKLVVI
jgi:hypothetical protein